MNDDEILLSIGLDTKKLFKQIDDVKEEIQKLSSGKYSTTSTGIIMPTSVANQEVANFKKVTAEAEASIKRISEQSDKAAKAKFDNIKVQDKLDKEHYEKKIKIEKDISKQLDKSSKEILDSYGKMSPELKKINDYYRELEKSSDSFYKKNKTGIDAQIEEQQRAAKSFSKSLKAQMQEKVSIENKASEKSTKNTRKEIAEKHKLRKQWISTIRNLEHKLATETRKIHQDSYREQISLMKQGTVATKKEYQKRLHEIDKLQGKANEAQRQMSRSALGVFDSSTGTTFGHKFLTTAQYMGAGTALYYLANGFKAVAKEAINYDKAIVKNAAVLEANAEEAVKLADANREIATTYGGVISEIDEAALTLGRAGVALEDVADATKLVVQMSIITGDTFADTSKVVSTFNVVFRDAGYSVEKLGGLLAYAANASKMSTQDLGTFSNYGLVTAKSLGMTAESVLALATSFSNIGLNASTVGTQIRKFEVVMNSSSSSVMKFWNILGKSQMDTMAKIKAGGKEGEQAFANLVDSIQGMSENEFMEATSGMEILTASFLKNIRVMGDTYDNHLEQLNKGGALLAIQSAKAASSVSSHLERMSNAFLTAGNSIGAWVFQTKESLEEFDRLEKNLKNAKIGSEEYVKAVKEIVAANYSASKTWDWADGFERLKSRFNLEDEAYTYKKNIDLMVEENKYLNKSIKEQTRALHLQRVLLTKEFKAGRIDTNDYDVVIQYITEKLNQLKETSKKVKDNFQAMLNLDFSEFDKKLQDIDDTTTEKKIATVQLRMEKESENFSLAVDNNNIENAQESIKALQKLSLEAYKLDKKLKEEKKKLEEDLYKAGAEFVMDLAKKDEKRAEEKKKLEEDLYKAGAEFVMDLAKKDEKRAEEIKKVREEAITLQEKASGMFLSEAETIDNKYWEILDTYGHLFDDEQLKEFFKQWKKELDDVNKQTEEYKGLGSNELTSGLRGQARDIANVGKVTEKIFEQQKKYSKYVEENGATEQAKSKYLQDQLSLYGNLAGSMSELFEQGSKEAAAFRLIQDGLALSAAVTAIASAGSGDPYTAIPRVIAMTAIMASLLSNIGQNFIGGGISTYSADSYSSMSENIGVGTSFGMAGKQSQSIAESLSIIDSFAEPQFREIEKLNKNFLILGNSIEKFVNQAVYSGVTSSSDFTPSFSSSDNVSKALDSIINMSLENSLLAYATSGVSVLIDIFSKITSPEKAIENILLSAVTGVPFDVVSLLLNTFGGDTKTSTALKDYGAIINEQLITTAIDSIMSDAYQTVRTVISTSYWDWGWRTDTQIIDKTVTGELDSVLKENLTMVFGNVYTSIVDAAKTIGISGVEEDLSDFVLPIAKISFDKSGEEIQKDFEAYISSVTDLLAEDALNGLLDTYRQVGEGLSETLVRVATEVNVVKTVLETVDTLSISNENILNASQNLIMLSGSLENFADITSGYYDSYFSDFEKLEDTTRILGNIFAELGFVAPKTYDEFRNIVESLDLNTYAGQNAYIELMKISDAFREIGDVALKSEANIKTWTNSFKTQDELVADMAGDLGVTVAKDLNELNILFENLSGGIDGLTDTELEFLQANKELLDTALGATKTLVEVQKEIDDAWLGSLSFLDITQKLAYANNVYANAITQEDRIAASRTYTELSLANAKTREDYAPIFLDYINELQNQNQDATIYDVTEGIATTNDILNTIVLRLEQLEETTQQVATYA